MFRCSSYSLSHNFWWQCLVSGATGWSSPQSVQLSNQSRPSFPLLIPHPVRPRRHEGLIYSNISFSVVVIRNECFIKCPQRSFSLFLIISHVLQCQGLPFQRGKSWIMDEGRRSPSPNLDMVAWKRKACYNDDMSLEWPHNKSIFCWYIFWEQKKQTC